MGKTVLNGQVVDTTSPSIIYGSVDIPDEVADFADLVTALASKVDEPASPVTFTQTYSTADSTIAAVTAGTPGQTAAAAVLTDTGIAAATPSATLTDSSAINPTEAEFNQLAADLGTLYNALRADLILTNAELVKANTDILETKKDLNRVIDILQTASLAA